MTRRKPGVARHSSSIRCHGEPEPGEAAEEGLERDLGLEPRERRSEAVVTAAAEGEVLRVGPADVEPIGLGEALRVPIGGVEDRDHELAAADRVATELDVRRRPAVQGPFDGSLVAQHLLDRARQERGVVPQLLELIGVREQADDRVPDQADGRLVAGDDQEHDRAEQLRFRERVLLVPRGQERADEVVLRVGAAGGEELRQVGDELAHLGGDPLHLVVPERGRDDRVRPLLEAGVVGCAARRASPRSP